MKALTAQQRQAIKDFWEIYKVAILSLILIIFSASVSFSSQRKDLRPKASGQSTYVCAKWAGAVYESYPGWMDGETRNSQGNTKKIAYTGSAQGWVVIYWCDYSKMRDNGGPLYCRDSNPDKDPSKPSLMRKSAIPIYSTSVVNYTKELSELIDYNHYGGTCQVIQVDVTPCCSARIEGGNLVKEDPNCGGGTSYVVYANTNCPTATPISTPTPTPTPTVVPPSCSNLLLNGQNTDINVTLNTPVSIKALVSNFGVVGIGRVSAIGKKLVEATDITRIAGRNSTGVVEGSFIPTKPGYYVVETNAFNDTSCQYLCASSSVLYKDKQQLGESGCNTAGHWEAVGSCVSNGCIHWITVRGIPTLTPTLTPTVTPTFMPTPTPTPGGVSIQGRIYEDEDTRIGSIGRGGFSAFLPPSGNWNKPESLGGYRSPLSIDLLTRINPPKDWDFSFDVANRPNTIDSCSSLSKQEKAYCPASHCSKYGGFSLFIPSSSPKISLGGKLYYLLKLNLERRAFDEGWRITEAYWAETATTGSCATSSLGLPCQDSSKGVRCDYTTFEAQAKGDLSLVQCNKCIQNIKVVEGRNYACLANVNSNTCSIYSFNRNVYEAYLMVPVQGENNRNLWIGVAKIGNSSL